MFEQLKIVSIKTYLNVRDIKTQQQKQTIKPASQ